MANQEWCLSEPSLLQLQHIHRKNNFWFAKLFKKDHWNNTKLNKTIRYLTFLRVHFNTLCPLPWDNKCLLPAKFPTKLLIHPKPGSSSELLVTLLPFRTPIIPSSSTHHRPENPVCLCSPTPCNKLPRTIAGQLLMVQPLLSAPPCSNFVAKVWFNWSSLTVMTN